METHAPHIHHTTGKKFSEYFYEFLMLFLAVFFGFLAEYQLEHQIEKDKESQFIKSLVDDLNDDIKSIDENIALQKGNLILMDSLLMVINDPALIKESGDLIYYAARVGPRLGILLSNTKTFEQLKYSGGFRLIKNSMTSDKIIAYYNLYPLVRMLEGIYLTEQSEFKKVASKIFDPGILRELEMENGSIRRSINNPKLRTYDTELLKEFGFNILQTNGSRRGILPREEIIKQEAIDLINYIEKNYKME